MREGIRYDWIIAVSNSAESGIKILKTYCKVSEIKQILVDLAKRDARKDAAAFQHGTIAYTAILPKGIQIQIQK